MIGDYDMRKVLIILILMNIVSLNASAITYSYTERLEERMLINALVGMIIISLIISFLLYRNIRKLKALNNVTKNFNELKQLYIDTSHDVVFLKDENLKYVFVNKNFEKFNNTESSHIIGYNDFDFLDVELAAQYRKNDMEVLDQKTTIIKEIKREDKIFRTTKFPVKLLNEQYGIGAYEEDVTEEYNNKRKLEEINDILNKSNNLLSSILESSPEVMVFALDNNYCYLSFNSRHEKIMKRLWGRDIDIGMNMLELISMKDYHIKFKENFDKALAGESFNMTEDYSNENLSRPVWQNYFSPMLSNDGMVIGLTCFMLNITDRKIAEEKIAYLSYHDSLTGLYNRRFLEEELKRLDVERNLPISIIMGDVNALKLTNDIFGHTAGDQLLQKVAEVFKKVCRADDIIARIGGDEFTVLLPKTNEEEAKVIISRIKDQFSKESVKAIKGSISMGYSTKNYIKEDIFKSLEKAENKMYSVKTLDRNDVNSTTINTIIETLHVNNQKEAKHSENVSNICADLGKAMGLSEIEIRRLKEAGFLHDIGKIVMDKSLYKKNETLTDDELEEFKQHPVVGYRILNSIDGTLDLAESTLAHHERWDGSGYPKGLKGEEIPKLARIIAVAEYYDVLTNKMSNYGMSREDAVKEIKKSSGSKFEPQIVDKFIEMILAQ